MNRTTWWVITRNGEISPFTAQLYRSVTAAKNAIRQFRHLYPGNACEELRAIQIEIREVQRAV